MVPADTRISIEYTTSKEDRCVYLVLRTNNETRIKAAPAPPDGPLEVTS